MQLQRKIIRISVVALLLILAVSVFVNIYLAVVGLPKFIENRIWLALQRHGVIAEAKSTSAGLFTGLRFNNLVVRDYHSQELTLLNADHVNLKISLRKLLARRLEITEITASGGDIVLPLSVGDGSPVTTLTVKRIQFTVENRDDKVVIRDFSGVLEGVDVTVHGELIKPDADDWERLRSRRKPFDMKISVQHWNSDFARDLIHGTRFFQEFSRVTAGDSSASLHVDCTVPVADVAASAFTIEATFSEFLYRGLKLDTLAVNAELSAENVRVKDLRLSMDNQEYLHGKLTLDRPADVFEGQFTFYGFPEKLIKVFSSDLPEQVTQNIPDFTGEPLMATVEVFPSPLWEPAAWAVNLGVSVTDVVFRDLTISSLKGDLGFSKGRLTFSDVTARMEPGVELSASGEFRIDNRELIVHAVVDGEPYFVTDFWNDPSFTQKYADVFRDFTWNPQHKPHCEVDLYLNRGFPKSGLIIDANARMANFTYNGVHVDKAEGHVFVDFPASLLVIDDMVVVKAEDEVAAAVAWHATERKVLFSLKSGIAADKLLTLFHGDWHDFLEQKGIVFETHPNVQGTGRIMFREPGTLVNVLVDSPRMRYKDATILGASGKLRIQSGVTAIRSTAERLTYRGWTLDGIDADLTLGEETGLCIGNVRHAAGLGLTFENTQFNANIEDDSVETRSVTDRVAFGNWMFSGVEAVSTYSAFGLVAESTMTSAAFNDLHFDAVVADISVVDEQVSADATIGRGVLRDQFTMTDVTGSCALDSGTFTAFGTIGHLSHVPTSASAVDVNMDMLYRDPVLDLTLDTDLVTCFDRSELRGVNSQLAWYDNMVSGYCRIDDVVVVGPIRGERVRGEFSYGDGELGFDTHWDTVHYHGGVLSGVDMTGAYSHNKLDMRLNAESGTAVDCRIASIETSLTYANRTVSIERLTGSMYDGKINADYYCNIDDMTGRVWLTLIDVNFGKLIRVSEPASELADVGVFSGKADLTFSAATDPISLTGTGKVIVENGDFWKVPLVSDVMGMISNLGYLKKIRSLAALGKMVPDGDLVNITELRGDLRFNDQTIHMPNLQSNGNLIAISAVGDYHWSDRMLNVRVTAEPLKSVISKFLPSVMDPFSLLFVRELTGTPDAPQWRELPKIRDLFKPREGSEDATDTVK